MATDKFEFSKPSQAGNYPPSVDFKQAVDASLVELLPNFVMNTVWYDYFYIFEIPVITDAPSLMGTWSMSTSGGTFGGGRDGVILKSGGNSGNWTRMSKDITINEFTNLDKPQRFRTAFQLTTITNATAYLTRGPYNSDNFYGFKIVNDTLYGVLREDANTERTVKLITIEDSIIFTVEAIFLPGANVIFRTLDPSDPGTNDIQKFVEKGSLTMPLPTGRAEQNLFDVYVTNDATETQKELEVSYFEYIQKR